jgi:hypothetical protein
MVRSSGRLLRGVVVSSTSAQALQWPVAEVGGFCYPAFVKVRDSSTTSPTLVLVVAVDCWVGGDGFSFLSVLSQDGGRWTFIDKGAPRCGFWVPVLAASSMLGVS